MNLNEVCMGQQEIVQIAVNRNPIPEEKILSHCHQNSLQTYVKWIYIYIYVGYLGSPLTNGVKMNRSGSLLLSVDGITIYASHSRGAQRTLNLNGVH